MKECLSERCNKILNILIEQKNPITIDEIAENLNVSNRTIRYDLEELENFLKHFDDIKVYKKARVGIWLEYPENKRSSLLNLISSNKTYIKPLSTDERKYYIIKQLLQAKDIIKMQNLANELYVSRVTIHNDLEAVEDWLEKFDLKLIKKQNYGLQISGHEINWRKAASELLSILKSNEELKMMLEQSNELHYDSRLDYKSFNQIKDLIPEFDLRKIETILNEAEERYMLSLTDEAHEGLVIHIAISLKRLKDENDIEVTKEQLMALINTKEYETAKWITMRLGLEFNISFSESEIAYLALHILGSKLHENIQLTDQNKIIEDADVQLLEFTKELIGLISNILSCNLNNDERLIKSLLLHLRPAINRMTYGLNLRNPLLIEIKSKYPAIFGACWATSSLFEKYYKVKVSEEEIGYIAMHIGAALERINNSLRAIVICSSGIGTCELVAARLKKQITDINILGTYSMFELKHLNEEDFDFIITTIPLDSIKFKNKPIVKISPFVVNEDINSIKNVMKKIDRKDSGVKEENGELINYKPQLFYEDLIFVNENIKSKKELIIKTCDILVKKGYVYEDFTSSVLNREKITSTSVGNNVAIPHGETDLVKKSCIAVITLKEQIEWGKEKADIIFLLALKFEDKNHVKNFFKYFYSILDDYNKLNRIRKSNTAKEILILLDENN